MAEALDGVIRRKVSASRLEAPDGGPGADRAWRLALARAARDAARVGLEVSQLTIVRLSMVELLELLPDRALIAVLEGPGQTMGLMVVGPDVLAGLVEAQTLGRVSTRPALPRRPTRTDAAMVAGMVDLALRGLEDGLSDDPDLIWAGGFRYASFLEDARPLALLLEDEGYRMIGAEVALGGGLKAGSILLAMPAKGRGQAPVRVRVAEPDPGPAFEEALTEVVSASDAVLDAVLARVTLPISVLMALQVGEVLTLPQAGLDRITLEGIDGARVLLCKLGQNRGMRAVRLSPVAMAGSGVLPAHVVPVPVPGLPVLRQTGTG